jgi:lipid II:glycine glycyltransferase (peptidoglycan interpeptide bridge formation enzyme)
MWKDILEKDHYIFNKFATHPLQSFAWGEFRKKNGIIVIRKGFYQKQNMLQAFQLTIHTIPYTSWTIGYVPKGTLPTYEMLEELKKIGKKYRCVFIQLEPNCLKNNQTISHVKTLGLVPSAHPLFTNFTFQLDLTKSEHELLQHMHPKTRYNIKVAKKYNVVVREEISQKAFNAYLDLIEETTRRQAFYSHSRKYHEQMWNILHKKHATNDLSAHLFVAWYDNIALATWIVFIFKDTLYYPYGASSNSHRETMASNLMMWEIIIFGKRLGLKKFDMWGALGENPDPHDPWFGFHRFKKGYGPELLEFLGSFDLIINPLLYQGYKIADKIRWITLHFKQKFM